MSKPSTSDLLLQAYSMLADINEGWPLTELCRPIPEFLEEAKAMLEEQGYTIDDEEESE